MGSCCRGLAFGFWLVAFGFWLLAFGFGLACLPSLAPIRAPTYLPEEELVRGVGRSVEGAVHGGAREDDGALQRDAEEEALFVPGGGGVLCVCVVRIVGF